MNPIATLSGSKGTVWSIAISPDGKTLASGSGKMFSFLVGKDNTVRIWNLASKEVIHSLKGHSDWVYSVAFSPDGQTLASGSKDNTIKLIDVASWKEFYILEGHEYGFTCVVFSPDGKLLASGSYGDGIMLWDVASGQRLRHLKAHLINAPSSQTNSVVANYFHCVAFSPDGYTLAACNFNNAIWLWDVRSGQHLCTLTGHSSSVYSVAFSPDGQTLISGSGDKTIKIWGFTD